MIDVHAEIKRLQAEKGWSENRLAIEAELTQSTISNLFNRRSMPSITTLDAICRAFGITLAQFFAEDEKSQLLNADELSLIADYRRLNKKQQFVIRELLPNM